MTTSSNQPRVIGVAALVLTAVVLLVTARVSGSWQSASDSGPRYATVDLMTLLEDTLQTDEYKPERDAFRGEWEERLGSVQQQMQQIEGELRVSQPQDPGVRQLQQQYQQVGYQLQQLQRQAGAEFDQFNAEQAAEAYETLYDEAQKLAGAKGYSHVFVSRRGGAIDERGNLATVTQEILARPVVRSPEGDDLTEALREALSIPVPPEPAEDAATPGTNMPMPATETENENETEESDD